MMAHTKGPWFSRWNGHFYDIGLENKEYAHSFASVHVNESLGIDRSISEANARLIAAAPNLLHVAELLVSWLDEEEGAHKLCDEARAAIAKATGGAA